MWVRLLSASPSWRTIAPCSPVMSRQRISRLTSGASTAMSRGRSSRRSRRTTASSSSSGASLTAMPDGAPPPAGGTSPGPPAAAARRRRTGRRVEPEAQRRALGADVGEVAGDRQVDRRDEVLPGAVVVHAVAQREPLRALRDERQHRAGHRRQRRVGCSTAEIRTPSTAVVWSGRAWRASSSRSSSRSPCGLKHITRDSRQEEDQARIDDASFYAFSLLRLV